MMLSCLLRLDMDQAQAFRFDNASYSILEYDGRAVERVCHQPGSVILEKYFVA